MLTFHRQHSSPRDGAQKPERENVAGFFVLRPKKSDRTNGPTAIIYVI
jgi:hypothetical protein